MPTAGKCIPWTFSLMTQRLQKQSENWVSLEQICLKKPAHFVFGKDKWLERCVGCPYLKARARVE